MFVFSYKGVIFISFRCSLLVFSYKELPLLVIVATLHWLPPPFAFPLFSFVWKARDLEAGEFYSSGFSIREVRPEAVKLWVPINGKITRWHRVIRCPQEFHRLMVINEPPGFGAS